MKFILIMVVFAGSYDGGAAIHHVEFATKDACEKAMRMVETFPATASKSSGVRAICTESGK